MMDLAASWAALEREEQEKEVERLKKRIKELEDENTDEPFDGGSKRFSSKRDDWG